MNNKEKFLSKIGKLIEKGGISEDELATFFAPDEDEAPMEGKAEKAQPMDENADDFEYQIIEAVQQILALIGIEDTPIFKRNRISNQKEQVEMILMEAPYLDDETILQKMPNITPDEVVRIMAAREAEDLDRLG